MLGEEVSGNKIKVGSLSSKFEFSLANKVYIHETINPVSKPH